MSEDGHSRISVGGVKDDDTLLISPYLEILLILIRGLADSAHGDHYYKMVGIGIVNGVMIGEMESCLTRTSSKIPPKETWWNTSYAE